MMEQCRAGNDARIQLPDLNSTPTRPSYSTSWPGGARTSWSTGRSAHRSAGGQLTGSWSEHRWLVTVTDLRTGAGPFF